jgi:hypothetical protein
MFLFAFPFSGSGTCDRLIARCYLRKRTGKLTIDRACGFCGGFLASRDRYFDHVARHYEDGCNKSHWNHSLVIYGLLHQPSISQAWKELDAELYGHLPRNQQPMLEWDPKLTGHAQGFLEGESPGKLQDLLEFFNEGRDDPKFLARLAHDSATIRLRNEVQPTAPIPSSASPSTRPVSEPLKQDHLLKSLPSTKHMSTPQAPPTSSPSYDNGPVLKKQRSLAHFPEPFPPKNNPFFTQAAQHPQPQPPQEVLSPFSTQAMMSPVAAGAGSFYDLTVTHVHPHMQLMSQMTLEQQQQLQQQEQLQQHQQQLQHQQHQQPQHGQQLQQHQQHQQHQQQQGQQQHLLAPMNLYDDWSSLAGTVVDEPVFTSAMAMGWQADLGRGHGHHGSG